MTTEMPQRPETRDQRSKDYSPPIPRLDADTATPQAAADLESFVGRVVFPKPLDTPASRKAVAEWVEHRRQRNLGTSKTQVEKQLNAWIERGESAFVKAVEWSIAQGDLGVKEPRPSTIPIRGQPPPPTAEEEARRLRIKEQQRLEIAKARGELQ